MKPTVQRVWLWRVLEWPLSFAQAKGGWLPVSEDRVNGHGPTNLVLSTFGFDSCWMLGGGS